MRQKIFSRRMAILFVLALLVTGISMAGTTASAVGRPSVQVTKRAKTTANLKITKVKGATGYQVFVATSRKGKYRQIGSTIDGNFKMTKLKKNKVYYIKVRAYKTTGSRIAPGKYSSVKKVPKYTNQTTAEKYAKQVLALVNEQRVQEGLEELKASSGLNEVALLRAKELVEDFSHTRPDGRDSFTALTEAGIVYTSAGENIAMGEKTPEEVVEDWMNSPGHRANILSDKYTQMGLGYYTQGGQYYWAQVFIKE